MKTIYNGHEIDWTHAEYCGIMDRVDSRLYSQAGITVADLTEDDDVLADHIGMVCLQWIVGRKAQRNPSAVLSIHDRETIADRLFRYILRRMSPVER